MEIITRAYELVSSGGYASLFDLTLLFIGHLIGDVLLQMNRLSKLKRKHLWALGLHVLMWSGSICLVLLYLKLFAVWKMLFLFASHFFIDWIKPLFKPSPGDLRRLTLVDTVDQLIHFISLGVVYFLKIIC